jgi:hypothetical protein
MRSQLGAAAALLVVLAALAAPAQQVATIELSVYPEAAVADGNSTLAVSATVRDRSGNYVPDGTEVAFSTSLGQFRDPIVKTAGGVARATLIAGNVAGKSKVTASVVNFAAVADVEVAFVEDGTVLRKTTSYVDVTADMYLAYAVDIKLIAATGSDQGARIAYRDIVVEADDLQMWLDSMRVVAYNAKLTVGLDSITASQLSYRLRSKTGMAICEVDGQERLMTLDGLDTKPILYPPGYNEFRFQELLDSTSIILADRIVANPNREVLFRNARVYAGANKLVSMPHYAVDLTRAGGLFNDQMFGINQDGIALDLPYYFSLGPRQSNSLRLRSQHVGGRTYTTSRGTTLDWVTKYADATDYSGDFVISDMVSGRWGATLRHTQRFSDTLDGYFVLDSPRHESLYGYAQLSQQFDGFHTTLSLSGREGFRESIAEDRRAELAVETNTAPLFGRSLYHSIGFTTRYRRYEYSSGQYTRQEYGLRYRARSATARLGPASLSTGITLTKFWGPDAGGEVGVQGTVVSAINLTPTTTFIVNYDYNQDQFGSSILGKHRLTMQLFAALGSLETSVYLSRGLDQCYSTVFADTSLRLSPLWRVGVDYTRNDSLGWSFDDYSILLAYQLGFREIGLRWSSLDHRLGVELLATRF